MFDPLFALIFLLAIAVPIAAVVFWAARKHPRMGSAAWMAFAMPVAGLIGFFGGMRLNYALDPVRFLDEPPLTRFGIPLVSGIVLAGFLGWLVWYMSLKKRG